ncbi:MAG: DUF5060 domain-containing protein, partial [Saprospiraceae bacterium]|nr:DUF5060 domain-containing protein [Saprospiraceae bacterium]
MIRIFLLALTLLITNQIIAQNITGELKKWHKVSLTYDGPYKGEMSNPNPFRDYRLEVEFTNGEKSYLVQGFFAADGNAAETSASAGDKWRVNFAPDETGTWNYETFFYLGTNAAINGSTDSTGFMHGITGSFEIEATDKEASDNRGKGRLQYVGERYLKYAETGDYFIKMGADAPETFLASECFDSTYAQVFGSDIKTWDAHVQDWNTGDPVWQGDKGKGVIGAINYLSEMGQNVFSFLTLNVNGDGRNVWPYVDYNKKLRFDCSKLDQWDIVFDHADARGMYLHFKTQETENDQWLDGGDLGNQRKIYYRELVARFGHHLALNWNLGEENTNTEQQRIDFAAYFDQLDPYDHNIVLHTYPLQYDNVYTDLLGNASELTGASMQIQYNLVHKYIK